MKVTNYDFSKLSQKQLVNKVTSANKKINEGMFIIGLATIEATDRLNIKRKDFAKDCGISESMLSKAVSAVKYFVDNGGNTANLEGFSYTKLALASRKPELFKAVVDNKGLAGFDKMSVRDIESVSNGSLEFKRFENDKPIYKSTKTEDKKAKDEAKADNPIILVTDNNGIKYNVPASILNKYKVTE